MGFFDKIFKGKIESELPKKNNNGNVLNDTKNLEITSSDYDLMKIKLRERFGKEPSDNDIQWGVLTEEKLKAMKFARWARYCDIENKMGNILQNEGKSKRALELYLECLYLYVNGPNNEQYFDPKNGHVDLNVMQKAFQLKYLLKYSNDEVKKLFFTSIETYWRVPLPISPQDAWDSIIKAFNEQKIKSGGNSSPNNKKEREFSKAHLLLLSKFRYLRDKESFVKADYWRDVLDEPPERALEAFLEGGLLREGSLEEKMDKKFKLTDLKSLMKTRNLPVTGKKALLIERLIQIDKAGMESLVPDVNIFICSDKGKIIVDDYLAREREIRDATEQKVLSFLMKGEFDAAIDTVAHYDAEQVFKRGIWDNWRNSIPRADLFLKLIFSATPKILNEYHRDQIEILRPAAAMMYLWGTTEARKWIPPDFSTSQIFNVDTAARMILFNASFLSSVNQYKKLGVESVYINTAPDSCENCKKHEGKIFKIDSVPELPYFECTHNIGCRCCILAKFPWEKT